MRPNAPLKRILASITPGTWGQDPVGDESDYICIRVADFARDAFTAKASDEPTRRSLDSETARRLALAPGDILLERSGDTGYPARYIGEPGVVYSNFLLRLRATSEVDARYLWYVLQWAYLSGVADVCTNRTTMSNLDVDAYMSTRMPLWSLSRQQAIADHLDRETDRMDALVAAKVTMLALLEERLAAQISALLFRSKAYRPERLKFICGVPTSGNRDHASFTYTADGVPCLRGIDLSEDHVDLSTVLRISAADSLRHANTVLHAGDLVIVRSGATAGRSALVTAELDGSNCVDLVVVRRSSAVEPRYLAHVIRSREIQEGVLQGASGALQPHFNAVDAGEVVVPMRPLDEQQRIVTTLDGVETRKEELVALIGRQIALLKERRRTLIIAAITGEIEISEAAA
jgi:type I restriction enzyme S subunit